MLSRAFAGFDRIIQQLSQIGLRWSSANFDDFRSPTGTSTSTRILQRTCCRDWMHDANGEPIECLSAALRDGKVFVADADGRVVRITGAAWQMSARTFREVLLADSCAGGAIVKAPAQQDAEHQIDPVTVLEVAVLRLNHRQQLATGRPDEVIRSCRQVNDPVVLRQPPSNESQFADFIAAMSRWLYDGTSGVTSAADRGMVTPALPKWCYRDHRSVIVHVIVLRNHYLHGLSRNASTAEEHLASAGDVFELYEAKRLPDDEDFAAIRLRLLAAATRFVDRLAAHVPVRDAVDAEAVFTTPSGEGSEERFLSQIGVTNLEQSE